MVAMHWPGRNQQNRNQQSRNQRSRGLQNGAICR